jgi:hypothetical protein
MRFLRLCGAVALAAVLATASLGTAWAQTKPAAAPKSASVPTAAVNNGSAIGTVDLLSGTVTVTALSGVPRAITPGMSLEVGDTIKTSSESEAHATMADGAYLAVRANSTIKITAYAANGNNKDTSLISLITGSLRTVTGWIAKSRPKAYRINTPTATVGVRGTDHEVIYYTAADAETEEEAGTHNVVYEGATILETPKGRVNVSVGQAAYIPVDAFLPKLHNKVLPVFLIRARGQYDSDVVDHRNALDGIMRRSLIERGIMAPNQNLQDVFKRIGGSDYVPNSYNTPSDRTSAQQRQVQGVQSDIFKQTFGGPGNTKEPLPMPFGLPGGGGNPNAPPPMSVPSPGGMPFMPQR